MPLLNANNLTDAELAMWIRASVSDLNDAVSMAYKRDLLVAYSVENADHSNPHFRNPRILVTVMTEVA